MQCLSEDIAQCILDVVSTVIQAFTEKSLTEMKEHPNGMIPMPDPHPKTQSMRILPLPIKTGVFNTQDSD